MGKCYLASLRDEALLKKSASGGMGAAVAEHVLNQGGVVYGAAFDDDFRGAKYIRVEDGQGLEKLRGSKYIRANTAALKDEQFIRDVESGRLVALIGLPCDVALAKNILKNRGLIGENLIAVDLICDGVTPTETAISYVDEMERSFRAPLKSLCLRHKNPLWGEGYLRAVFSNGRVYLRRFRETEYGFAFTHMKESACYHCRLRGDARASDFTIGDAWGAKPGQAGHHPLGTSVVFTHSERGEGLIHRLQNIRLTEADAASLMAANPRYLNPRRQTPADERFRKDFEKLGLHRAYRKHCGLKKRLLKLMPYALLEGLRKLKK